MKNVVSFLWLFVCSAIVISCQSKQQQEAQAYMDNINQTMKENSPPAANGDEAMSKIDFTLPADMKQIIGEWELEKIVDDTDGSKTLDEAEENRVITPGAKDYLKLNADGTCVYSFLKVTGTYKIETTDDDKKKLLIYAEGGRIANPGNYIYSVTANRLIINRISGGSDFEIFKRF